MNEELDKAIEGFRRLKTPQKLGDSWDELFAQTEYLEAVVGTIGRVLGTTDHEWTQSGKYPEIKKRLDQEIAGGQVQRFARQEFARLQKETMQTLGKSRMDKIIEQEQIKREAKWKRITQEVLGVLQESIKKNPEEASAQLTGPYRWHEKFKGIHKGEGHPMEHGNGGFRQ